MATGDENLDRPEKRGVGYTFVRSVFNHYWIFSLLSLGAGTTGMAIAAFDHPWRWELWAAMAAFLWTMDQGMKTLDLSVDELAVNLDARVQRAVGFGMVGVGVLLGVLLAAMSTWWFLVVLVAGALLGLAYNLEWFGGRLHDKKYHTGWGNLGFVLGWLTTFTGYFLLAEEFSLGIAIFSLGPMIGIGTMIYVEKDIKREIYETAGFVYTRTVEADPDRLRRRTYRSHRMRIVSYVAMGLGLAVEALL